jgi:hypothetical protein
MVAYTAIADCTPHATLYCPSSDARPTITTRISSDRIRNTGQKKSS